MNTQKRNQPALLALAALLTLPVGLQADTQTPTVNGQSVDRSSVLHLSGDEGNSATPEQIRDATARAGGSDAGSADLNGTGYVDLHLNTEAAKASIEAADFAAREQALSIAERGASEGRTIAGAIENGSGGLQVEARNDLDKAMRKADQARGRLNQAIERGRNSTEGRWDNAREELSTRYEQYANALEKARDTAVGNGARLESRTDNAPSGPASRN